MPFYNMVSSRVGLGCAVLCFVLLCGVEWSGVEGWLVIVTLGREGGREGGRKGGREGGREEGREGGRKGGREEGRKGGRKGGREGGVLLPSIQLIVLWSEHDN